MSKLKIGNEYKSKDGRRHIRIIDIVDYEIHYEDLIHEDSSYFVVGSATYAEMEFFK